MIKTISLKGDIAVNAKAFHERYRKVSIIALITGILAIFFCILYFILWTLFDDFLTSLIANNEFVSYIIFTYVFVGIVLTIATVITGSIDLKKIKRGNYSRKGEGFDITGIILGSLLMLFGFVLWFVDFFGFINIIT